MAKGDAQAAAAEAVAADPAPTDPDAPAGPAVAQDGSQDPVAHAERLAVEAGDRITAAALVAQDLTADAARALYGALRDAVQRVERVVKQHDDAAAQ